jgi:hypothetical protein
MKKGRESVLFSFLLSRRLDFPPKRQYNDGKVFPVDTPFLKPSFHRKEQPYV